MATKGYTVNQPLMFNRQLKEWNDNLASERDVFYQLRSKHGVERDQLRVDRITDAGRQRKLSIQQANEMNQLRKQTAELRLAILERHAIEKTTLKRVS